MNCQKCGGVLEVCERCVYTWLKPHAASHLDRQYGFQSNQEDQDGYSYQRMSIGSSYITVDNSPDMSTCGDLLPAVGIHSNQ